MSSSTKLTEDQKGNLVAKAVWKWLQEEKAIEFVPWVIDPQSYQHDALKEARQEERNQLLHNLEEIIKNAIPR